MLPLIAAGLANFGPALLQGLFGGESPQEKLRKQIMALLNPQYQQGLINQNYQNALGSPMFAQGQGSIAAGANATAGQLGQSLGARGIGTSGTGAILSSLTPSIVGSQMAGLRSGLYQGAQNQAMQNIQQQIAALQGTAGPGMGSQLFGAGLSGFEPFLTAWLKSKYPSFGGVGTPANPGYTGGGIGSTLRP